MNFEAALAIGLAAQASVRLLLVETIFKQWQEKLKAWGDSLKDEAAKDLWLETWLYEMLSCKWCFTVWMVFFWSLVWGVYPPAVIVVAAISVAYTMWGMQGFFR